MLSLVAYGNSSGSESDSESDEFDEPDNIVQVKIKSYVLHGNVSSNNIHPINKGQTTSGELFTKLPQPKANQRQVIEEEQDEFLQKREQVVEKPQKRIKIDIPSLTQYESDEDEPSTKIPKQEIKASGLFALLPAPKGTPLSNTSFVPNVLKKKTNKPAQSKTTVKSVKNKIKPQKKADVVVDSDSNDEDDIEIPETYDDETWQKVCGKKKRQTAATAQDVPVNHLEPVYIVESAPEVTKPYAGLSNEAFKKLVGSKKRVKENIKLIDIHEDEIRPDKVEWLKSLTDPNCEPKTVDEEPVNSTCKVKNHITALAQKALVNDKELQMRWAESRNNKIQSQAKYGF